MGHDGSSYGDKVFSGVMKFKPVGELSSTKGQSAVGPSTPEAQGLPVGGSWTRRCERTQVSSVKVDVTSHAAT